MVPLSINFDDGTYTDRRDIDNAEFFKLLADAEHPPKTAQPAPGAFVEVFDAAADAGRDVLCLTMSARMSGTHSSAVTAADIGRPGIIVELGAISGAVGRARFAAPPGICWSAAACGPSCKKAARIRRGQELLFTVPDLVALRAGGRIGAAAAS